MQAQSEYNGVITRNIAAEMADHALERGQGLTRKEYKQLGYTDDQIDRNGDQAAVLYQRASLRRVA